MPMHSQIIPEGIHMTQSTRSTMSSDFTRIAGNTRLDIYNAWQAGAFVGDINGKPAKWAVYERAHTDSEPIGEVAERLEPAYLSLRKSDAIDWLITRQENLQGIADNLDENAEVGS